MSGVAQRPLRGARSPSQTQGNEAETSSHAQSTSSNTNGNHNHQEHRRGACCRCRGRKVGQLGAIEDVLGCPCSIGFEIVSGSPRRYLV